MASRQIHDDREQASEQMQPALLSRVQVQRIYDRLAPVYDRWTTPFESRARARVLELIASYGADRVLEVAVGPGTAFAKILAINPRGLTVGLDISRKMLGSASSKARGRGKGSRLLICGDARHLPLLRDSFDLVTNSYMLDLLPVEDIRSVLSEFKRVLKPGGALVLTNMTLSRALLSRTWEWLYRRNPAMLGGCRGVKATHFLEGVGFTEVTREVITQLTFPSEVLTATKP